MQVRMNDIHVFECPAFLIGNPIVIQYLVFIYSSENDTIETVAPLKLLGITPYLNTRKYNIHAYELIEIEVGISDFSYDFSEW